MTNQELFYQIFNLSRQNPILDALMIFGAEYLIFVTMMIMLLLTFKGAKETKALVLAILGFSFMVILIKIIHLFYQEPRPFVTLPINPLIYHALDDTFPSGHTSTMAVVAFSYLYYRSKFALLFFIFLLWVGFARIFVGVHYPLDILGGIITGLAAATIAWQIKNWVKKYI